MRIMPHLAPLLAVVFSACAATTPAPRLSPLDPADPKAQESSPKPFESGLGDAYSCPMHPEVRQAGPGQCRLCGMALASKTQEGSQP